MRYAIACCILAGSCVLIGCDVARGLRFSDSPSKPRIRGSFVEMPGYPVQTIAVANFQPVEVSAAEHDPEWCWAACASIIRTYYHSPQTQESIAARITGAGSTSPGARRTAAQSEALAALDPDNYERVQSNESDALSAFLGTAIFHASRVNKIPKAVLDTEPKQPSMEFDPGRLLADLKASHPALAGLHDPHDRSLGHCIVVIGVQAQTIPARSRATTASPGDEVRILRVRIWDPDIDEPGEKEMSGSEFASRCDFFATREEAHAYLQYLDDHAKWIKKVFGEPGPATAPARMRR